MALTLDTAQELVRLAQEHAEGLGIGVSVCVADPFGRDLITARADGAPWLTAQVARDKAATAALMGQTTEEFGSLIDAYPALLGHTAAQVWFTPATLGGGLPIMIDGSLVGAIAVSGGTVEQDIACATHALSNWAGI